MSGIACRFCASNPGGFHGDALIRTGVSVVRHTVKQSKPSRRQWHNIARGAKLARLFLVGARGWGSVKESLACVRSRYAPYVVALGNVCDRQTRKSFFSMVIVMV
ncbi:unnamed protein product, partial [Ectocarpus sp. 6 AP-2014]